MSISDYREFTYHVVVLAPNGVDVGEYVALCNNILVARAAFFAILPERPHSIVQLTQRIRVILDSREDGPGCEVGEGL